MSLPIASWRDLRALRRLGRIVAGTLAELSRRARPGMTTADVDAMGADLLAPLGVRSAPRLVYGFPGTVIVSVNDEAVHAVPGDRILRPGDLVTLDITAERDGFVVDAAVSLVLPPVSPRASELCACSAAALARGIAAARDGVYVRDIGRAIDSEVRRRGFRVIPSLAGHGVGRSIHEEPAVPNFFDPHNDNRVSEGMVLALEPIVSAGSNRIFKGEDGWGLRTTDGSLAAHFEHTILVTKGEAIVLTAP